MDEIELNEVRKLVDELDRRVPKDGARVKLDFYGGGADESMMQANQKGYLRLGIEFLKAAFAPVTAKSGQEPVDIDVDMDYLIDSKDPIHFDMFERREDIAQLTPPRGLEAAKDKLLLVGCAIVLSFFILICLLGLSRLFDIIRALF